MIDHSFLNKENIFILSQKNSTTCVKPKSFACIHGTYIAGILKANRGNGAPAICPDCTLFIRPVFSEIKVNDDNVPFTTPKELAKSIYECINANVLIINLSLALANPSINNEIELKNALDYAANKGVIVVAAAGNQGIIGSTCISRHPWVIPVIACKNDGAIMNSSNISNSIGKYGLSAQGDDIESLGTYDNLIKFSGTSVATPFVTGIIALLWSEFPHLSASEIKHAVTIVNKRRSIIPPLVNAKKAFQYLELRFNKKKFI